MLCPGLPQGGRRSRENPACESEGQTWLPCCRDSRSSGINAFRMSGRHNDCFFVIDVRYSKDIMAPATSRSRWSSRSLSITLCALYMLCFIGRLMCGVPDVPMADGYSLSEGTMFCAMDGTGLCPPSLPSSAEREVNAEPDRPLLDGTISLALAIPTSLLMAPSPWSRSNVLSIVPISIASSPVLRI